MLDKKKLKTVAGKLVAAKKGILAADESTGSIEKRLSSIGVKSTEKTRRDYRQLLFTSPNIAKYISGVILFEETLFQDSIQGIKLVKLLKDQGIIPGIKVDKKTHPLALFENEEITEGLDGLRDRLKVYAKAGAEFAKWRAVFHISRSTPSNGAIVANAHALARYAALVQEAGLVPIVEPEILLDGSYSIEKSAQVSQQVLKEVYQQLALFKIYLPGTLLKPSFITPGSESKQSVSSLKVAQTTVEVFKRVVPKKVPGIVFLSGGHSPETACDYLNQINKQAKLPWQMSYSFGRALQQEALRAWGGHSKNVPTAQEVFYQRAQTCSLARQGKL